MECCFHWRESQLEIWKYIKLTEDVLLHFPEAMLFHYIFNYNQIE